MENKEISFGIRIEHILVDKGIKPSRMCEEAGIHQQQFYDWKRKGTVPNAMTALRIARFLGTTVEYLLTGDDRNPLQAKVDELQERLKKINAIVYSMQKKTSSDSGKE